MENVKGGKISTNLKGGKKKGKGGGPPLRL